MVLALVPAAFAAEPYTLDIYWVGNGDNPEIREGVEKAINDYIEPLIDAHVHFHIVGWDDWKAEVVDILEDKDARKKAKMDLVFTADWCAPCKAMQQTVFTADTVATALSGYNVLLEEYAYQHYRYTRTRRLYR